MYNQSSAPRARRQNSEVLHAKHSPGSYRKQLNHHRNVLGPLLSRARPISKKFSTLPVYFQLCNRICIPFAAPQHTLLVFKVGIALAFSFIPLVSFTREKIHPQLNKFKVQILICEIKRSLPLINSVPKESLQQNSVALFPKSAHSTCLAITRLWQSPLL